MLKNFIKIQHADIITNFDSWIEKLDDENFVHRMTRIPWHLHRCNCCNNCRRQRVPRLQSPQTRGRRMHCRMSNISCCYNNILALERPPPRTQHPPPYLVRRKSTLRICRVWPPSRLWATLLVSMVSVDWFYFYFRLFIVLPLFD